MVIVHAYPAFKICDAVLLLAKAEVMSGTPLPYLTILLNTIQLFRMVPLHNWAY